MPTHYHLIISAPAHHTISQIVQFVNGNFARTYNLSHGTSGPVFRHRCYDHAVRDIQDYRRIATYIHNNPVRAGLVKHPEDYSWSSARARLLGQHQPLKLDDPAG